VDLGLDAALQQDSLDQALASPDQKLQRMHTVQIKMAHAKDFSQSTLAKPSLDDIALVDNLTGLQHLTPQPAG
jgi:hypothetical protein